MSRAKILRVLLVAMLLPFAGWSKLQGRAHADSLLAALQTLPGNKDSLKFHLLDGISYSLRKIEPASGTRYAEQAYRLAKKMKWKKGIARANTLLAINHQNTADPSAAIVYGLRAMNQYTELHDEHGIATAQTTLANAFADVGNFSKGLEYHTSALRKFEKSGDRLMQATTLGNIGNIYQVLNDYPQALVNDMNALKIFRQLEDSSGIARNLGNIGNIYTLIGDYNAALDYNFNALQIYKQIGEQTGVALTLGNIGEIYLQVAKDAASHKQRSASAAFSQPVALRMAISHLERGMHASEEVGLIAGIQEFKAKLAEACRMDGDYKRALSLSREYNTVRDSMFSRQNIQRITVIESQHEKERKQKELEVQNLQLIASKHTQRYYIAGLALVAVIAGSVLRRIRSVRRTRNQLEEKNKLIAAEREQAELMKQRAERSERFKHKFLANMSHEIRTPMYAVSGMTDLLLEKSPRTDQLHYLKVISRSSEILLHIIDDILDVSRIEAGKIEIRSVDFSLIDVIRQVKETLAFRAEEKGLLLTASIDDNIPPVLVGDPFRLNQVLINLGGNAIKFTATGSVDIAVQATEQSNDEVTLSFRVMDTGIGIPADKIDKLFTDFSQAQSSDTRMYGGTGLGLSISRKLVELQRGAMFVESTQNKGSLFSFTLSYPVGSRERLAQQQITAQDTGGYQLDDLEILLADDNDYNRLVVSETLRAHTGITPDEVVNGRQVMMALSRKRYDVVLMDIRMPEIDGLEATRLIRALPPPAGTVAVIAMTASLMAEDAERCREAGMDQFLSKPFRPWHLISAIATATGRSKTTGRTEDTPEPPANQTAATTTDLSYLRTFCDGDTERMKKFVRAYIASVPSFSARISSAINEQNLEDVASQIHALKPRLKMMGMTEARALVDNIENNITLAWNEMIAERIDKFLLLMEKSVEELKEFA